jgi:hypothetical protein
MGQSKNLFIAHREEMLAQMNRKELAQEAEFYATKLLEQKEPEEILSQTLRIESFVSAINKELKAKVTENTSFGGVEFSEGQRTVLNFKEDPIYNDLHNELKNREDLLKARVKLMKPIFDENGEEVPLVSSTTSSFIKASIK